MAAARKEREAVIRAWIGPLVGIVTCAIMIAGGIYTQGREVEKVNSRIESVEKEVKREDEKIEATNSEVKTVKQQVVTIKDDVQQIKTEQAVMKVEQRQIKEMLIRIEKKLDARD